jgi:hypothetical protein
VQIDGYIDNMLQPRLKSQVFLIQGCIMNARVWGLNLGRMELWSSWFRFRIYSRDLAGQQSGKVIRACIRKANTDELVSPMEKLTKCSGSNLSL